MQDNKVLILYFHHVLVDQNLSQNGPLEVSQICFENYPLHDAQKEANVTFNRTSFGRSVRVL